MFSETQQSSNADADQDVLVSLSSLSSLTGFPLNTIKAELFGNDDPTETVRLSRLRELMVSLLDRELLNS